MINFKGQVCFLFLSVIWMVGCSSPGNQGRALIRQQSATIESLRAEVLRLNQELDGGVGSRGILYDAKLKVAAMFADQLTRGDMWINLDSRGLVVTALDLALFSPEGNQLSPEGEMILGKIGSVLSGELSDHRVILEGYTAGQSVEVSDRISDRDHSLGRANAVLDYWVGMRGLAAERFGVTGYAEYGPGSFNDAEDVRDRTRRVEIVVLPQRIAHASQK